MVDINKKISKIKKLYCKKYNVNFEDVHVIHNKSEIIIIDPSWFSGAFCTYKKKFFAFERWAKPVYEPGWTDKWYINLQIRPVFSQQNTKKLQAFNKKQKIKPIHALRGGVLCEKQSLYFSASEFSILNRNPHLCTQYKYLNYTEYWSKGHKNDYGDKISKKYPIKSGTLKIFYIENNKILESDTINNFVLLKNETDYKNASQYILKKHGRNISLKVFWYNSEIILISNTCPIMDESEFEKTFIDNPIKPHIIPFSLDEYSDTECSDSDLNNELGGMGVNIFSSITNMW